MMTRNIGSPGRGVVTALAAVALMSLPAVVHAASPCALGFLEGTTPTIDGQLSPAGEWSDAATRVITSATSGCLGKLMDLDLNDYDVTIRTKSYMRGGQHYFGFRFEVADATSATVAGGGTLAAGERIAIQFDHNASGGATLEASDRRLIITHKWEASVADPSAITGVQVSWSSGTGAASAVCDPGPRWATEATLPVHAVAARRIAGGYVVEFEIQVASLGTVGTTNYGVAVQIINDWGGAATVGGVLANSSGSSFPADLPFATTDNAVNGTCNSGWRVPQEWGTGYFTTAPVDVWIARTPVFWNSVDINALACGTPSYTYHPTRPCHLTLTARLHKNVTGPQTRNILFMWADHGASPTTWRVMEFRENVVLTDTAMTITSAQWTSVPTGLANHPCVRVYILPVSSSAARTTILAINNAATLAAMEATYAVEAHHWAQKNIHAPGTANCTVTGCFHEGDGALGSLLDAYAPRPFTTMTAHANVLPLLQVVAPGRDQPGTIQPQQQPRVQLNAAERRLLSEHAYVQVRAIGWEPGPVDSLPYILAEPLGGLIQAIPLGMLKENNGRFDMRFNVGNPGTRVRHVFLTVNTEVPAGQEPLNVRIDTAPRRMQPNAEERRESVVQQGPGGGGSGPKLPGCAGGGGNAVVGFGLIFVWLAYGRTRRRDD